MTAPTTLEQPPAPALPPGKGTGVRRGDRIFKGISTSAGVLVLVIMAGIGLFLLVKAIPALRVNTVNFFTSSEWLPDSPSGPKFGIAALAFGTPSLPAGSARTALSMNVRARNPNALNADMEFMTRPLESVKLYRKAK